MHEWKVGDWAIHDRGIVQIKEIREGGGAEVSDGMFATSGQLLPYLRPLTLRNKRIAEYFAHYYRELNKIDGSMGFNFPDISRHFNECVLKVIDAPDDKASALLWNAAPLFVEEAKEYKALIQGVRLFGRR